MVNQSNTAQYQEFHQALKELIGPIQFSKDINLKLERISHLLKLIGDPHKSFPAIHVGGTSGKGSTATLISEILTQAGYKTGLHTSPHLQIINERFQINNQLTPSNRLGKIYKELQPAIAEVAQVNPFGPPSYFEVQVAIAFKLFEEENVDVAVIEVGLGGALDATNVLDAQIAVLTNIGLDHTSILGDTVELIAKDKAGIIKPGQTVISGLTQPSTQKIIADRCDEVDATLWQFGDKIEVINVEDKIPFSVVLPGRAYQGLHLKLLGDFQIYNAVCAVAAVHAFNPELSLSDIQRGLFQAVIPGRMEIVQQHPTIILDGAHNPDKILAASAAVAKHFPIKRRIVIFSLKKDKALPEVIPYVIKDAAILILTAFTTELWQPFEPETLAETARNLDPHLEIHIQPDPIPAVELALSMAQPDDLIWITGSLYLVGNARFYWYPLEKLFEDD